MEPDDQEAAQKAGSRDAPVLPGHADCLEELDRLVRQGALSPDARAYALLSYLVGHYLKAGPGVPIKAYAIAVDVLGRGPEFDPAQDSIVRVEIGRLRKLLEMYFLGPGRWDPVRFVLPKGQTHLDVHYGGRAAAPSASASVVSILRPVSWFWAPRRQPWILAAALVLVAIVASLALRDPGEAEIAAALDEDFPRVFVLPFAKGQDLGKAFPENALSSFIAVELSAFRSFRVIAPQPATTLPVRMRDYLLEGRVLVPSEATQGQVQVTLWLRDGVGTVLWTDRLSFAPEELATPQPVFAALSGIASTLGGVLGVIDSDGRARLTDAEREWAKGSPSDFRCILHWQSFDLTKDPDGRLAARACLEDRTARDTPVGQVWSALAFLHFLDWTEAGASRDDPRINAALAAANRALLLDPNGAEGHEALGSILTGLGRFDEAREVLARALEINPSNLDTAVKLGWLDCLEGDWETGTAHIRQVADRYTAVPGWYRLPLALEAWRVGDAAGLRQEAGAILASGDRRGLVLALAAALLAGDEAEETRQRQAMARAKLDPGPALAEIEAVFPDSSLIADLKGRL